MKKRELTVWVALLVALLPAGVTAGTSYRTAELQRLLTELHIAADTLHEGAQHFNGGHHQVSVVVQQGRVQHVGYRLFTDEMKAAIHSPALDFLERYFLQLSHPQADRPRERMLREDRVFFKKGSPATIATLRPEYAFSLNYDQKRYQASWSDEGREILTITFPAVHELISGENKQEAEANVEEDIRHAAIAGSDDIDASELSPTLQKDFLLKQGATYMNKLFSSDLYYQRQGDTIVLVSDVSHPLESVANMLIDPAFQSALTLKLQQVLYGYKKKSFDVPLQNWIAYCKSMDCELYYGIESFDKDVVKATVIAVNTTENYNHILYLTIPVEAIDTRRGDISGTLQTFIPMHNVKSLLAQYRKVEKRKRSFEQ